MRILQIIQRAQLRGAEVFACQLSAGLIKLGHRVDVLILFGDKNGLAGFDLPIYELGANEARRFTDFAGFARLSRFIKEGNYDIIQANAGDTLKYVSLSKLIYRWKGYVVFRNANKMSDFLNSSFKYHFNKWLLGRVDFVASVSEECRVDFVRTFNWDKPKIATLPIGIDKPVYSGINPLVTFGYNESNPVLLHVAGFVREKNHAGLLRIFKRVLDAQPHAKLVLIGDGPLYSSIKELLKTMGLEENVVMAGRRKDVNDFMRFSTVLVLPSLIEGLPGVILEGFINRLPVIAYNVGGISEVVKHGVTGWLIDKNNEDAFSDQIIAVLGVDKAKRSMICNEAHKLVSQDYTNDSIALRFLEAYQNILNN